MSTLDWSKEWLSSLIWVSVAFALASAGFVAVSVVLGRYTGWGGQVWRLAGPWLRPTRDRASWGAAALILALLALIVVSVRISVLLSYNTNALYTALQDYDAPGFWRALGIFAVLAAIYVVQALVAYLVGQMFVIRLWKWLTERLVGDWLGERSYHRAQFTTAAVDNPDQRIQQDVNTFATVTQELPLGPTGAVNAVVSIVSFTGVLWGLSGPLSVFGHEIPRAMTFIVFLYVIVASVFAFRVGKPLVRLNFLNEGLGAYFRYALVRVRDNSENIAFYRGEAVEKRGLDDRFSAVITNYWRIVFRSLKFQGFNLGVSQIAVVFPIIIQAPRFFARSISLGDVQQTAGAFGQVHDALSFFRNTYDQFAAYRAVLDRLTGLLDVDAAARRLPRITLQARTGEVTVRELTVSRPNGDVLVENLELSLGAGTTLLVTGRSGNGKTTLLRSLADLWPHARGTLTRPIGPRTMFLAQQPYLPLGTLRTALAYPEPSDSLDDTRVREVLRAVALANLEERLDEENTTWWRILSPGEQQRLGFGRLLLARPDVVFLDEATAALDEDLEHELYTLVRRELPNTILVSVGHRSSLNTFHDTRLELQGQGRWNLTPIAS